MYGERLHGLLGSNISEDQLVPAKVDGLKNIQKVYTGMGGSPVIAIDTNKEMYVWGGNDYGELGTGDNVSINIPIKNSSIKDIEEVQMDEYGWSIVARDSYGNLYAWGYNGYGKLGVGDTNDKSSPTKIEGIGKSKKVYFFSKWDDSYVINDLGECYKLYLKIPEYTGPPE